MVVNLTLTIPWCTLLLKGWRRDQLMTFYPVSLTQLEIEYVKWILKLGYIQMTSEVTAGLL